MKTYTCIVCGLTVEGDTPPDFCPQCGAGADKFEEVDTTKERSWADEHRIGVAKGVDPEIIEGLRANFQGECTEVGMYLAMSRQADREGYPQVAEAYKRIAWEEAEHAAKFAEMLGEQLLANTKANLKVRVDAEHGACAGKKALATKAKQLNLDAIHDTVHEMCKDEARHGSVFQGLLQRYFPAASGPEQVEVKAGDKILFCACGYSKTMPYCDNAHKVTGGKPKLQKFDKDESIWACACGKTGNAPFCDGSHKK